VVAKADAMDTAPHAGFEASHLAVAHRGPAG
jgi:hypothetical protein